jgi:hypothetical protein
MQHLQAPAYVLQTKDLRAYLSPLDATLTKNRGVTQMRFDGTWLELIATNEDFDDVEKGPLPNLSGTPISR